MNTGFLVLCDADGVVTTTFGEGPLVPGVPLWTGVAHDSRERLVQILRDARETEQHTILQMRDGTTLDLHCAEEEGRLLVVAAATAAGILSRCESVFDDPRVGGLARRLAARSRPDELSLDIWSELARLNNDLSTAQRQLAKSNAELRWLNEQKNELLGMAAHDLRNPLAAVLAYLYFVSLDAAGLGPEQQRMIGRIQSNVQVMLAIVEDVLDFSAIESGTVRLEMTTFTVAELFAEIAATSGPLAERKNIHILSTIEEGVGPLVADRRKITQVLDNLVTNALKFSHPGSTVTLAARTDPEGGSRMAVSDQGVGMSPEQIARLFQPFGRVGVAATAGEKGTGLGLAIVKRIVELHGGAVAVTSRLGQGTEVVLSVPGAAP